DPKTTAAVGAMLCILAEGNLDYFFLPRSKLVMPSTARFVGVMAQDNLISAEHVLFEPTAAPAGKALRPIQLSAPAFIGYRHFRTPRWPASPLQTIAIDFAVIEREVEGGRAGLQLPVKV